MNHPAENIIPMHANEEAVIKTGTIEGVSADTLTIMISGILQPGKKAFSCLIDPEPGDQIICSVHPDGLVYVLGIIERPNRQETNLTFPSDANIRTQKGSLHISAPERINVASSNVDCFAARTTYKSNEAFISCHKTIATGNEIQASFHTIRFISQMIHTMARQVMSKFKGYARHTEDNDMVRSGQMTRKIDGLYAMDSKNTIMNSKKITKIDGEKILMG